MTNLLEGAMWDLDGTKFRYAAHTREALVRATAHAAHDLLTAFASVDPVPSLTELEEIGLDSFRRTGIGTSFLREYGIPEKLSHSAYHSYCPLDIITPDPQLRAAFEAVADLDHIIYTHAHAVWARTALDIQNLSVFYPEERIVSVEKIGFARKDQVEDGFHHCARIMGRALPTLAMIEDSPNCLRIPKQLGMTTILIADEAPAFDYVDHCVPDAVAACKLLYTLSR